MTWEFPFPKDAPTVDKTAVVKDSNNPEYNASFKIVINPRDKVALVLKDINLMSRPSNEW